MSCWCSVSTPAVLFAPVRVAGCVSRWHGQSTSVGPHPSCNSSRSAPRRRSRYHLKCRRAAVPSPFGNWSETVCDLCCGASWIKAAQLAHSTGLCHHKRWGTLRMGHGQLWCLLGAVCAAAGTEFQGPRVQGMNCSSNIHVDTLPSLTSHLS
jgi:hypothetical protein